MMGRCGVVEGRKPGQRGGRASTASAPNSTARREGLGETRRRARRLSPALGAPRRDSGRAGARRPCGGARHVIAPDLTLFAPLRRFALSFSLDLPSCRSWQVQKDQRQKKKKVRVKARHRS
jgi:hypothetical protein